MNNKEKARYIERCIYFTLEELESCEKWLEIKKKEYQERKYTLQSELTRLREELKEYE